MSSPTRNAVTGDVTGSAFARCRAEFAHASMSKHPQSSRVVRLDLRRVRRMQRIEDVDAYVDSLLARATGFVEVEGVREGITVGNPVDKSLVRLVATAVWRRSQRRDET